VRRVHRRERQEPLEATVGPDSKRGKVSVLSRTTTIAFRSESKAARGRTVPRGTEDRACHPGALKTVTPE
jgi:hypothetical protein